ncbi:hypothetical protein ATANTOWER_019137 [Ataeniobius toweri]|uniref:Uncharacterized protein n=1 Tax=Ataeniobius toweri TaxID=208326 RepID=A0ABU7CA44_9TELE|nr:hypothetical protein [Ataeniobius toweri]
MQERFPLIWTGLQSRSPQTKDVKQLSRYLLQPETVCGPAPGGSTHDNSFLSKQTAFEGFQAFEHTLRTRRVNQLRLQFLRSEPGKVFMLVLVLKLQKHQFLWSSLQVYPTSEHFSLFCSYSAV